jgi:hypothetical protein
MTMTDTLLAALRATYPTLTFNTIEKAQTAHADDNRYADLLVGVTVQDFLITEPYESTCGRFAVDPSKTYGIPLRVADAIVQHNAFPPTSRPAPAAELFQ